MTASPPLHATPPRFPSHRGHEKYPRQGRATAPSAPASTPRVHFFPPCWPICREKIFAKRRPRAGGRARVDATSLSATRYCAWTFCRSQFPDQTPCTSNQRPTLGRADIVVKKNQRLP